MKTIVLGTLVTALFISSIPVLGAAQGVPGELVLAFVNEPAPAIARNARGLFVSRHSNLNNSFERHSLLYVEPLFSDRSLVKNIYLLRFPAEANVDAILLELRALPYVHSVERNMLVGVDAQPNDYHFNHDVNTDGQLDQWTYYYSQFNRAWDITTGDSTVIAAVIDTGLDWEAKDLRDRVWINSEEDINENGVFDNLPSGIGGDGNAPTFVDTELTLFDAPLELNRTDLAKC